MAKTLINPEVNFYFTKTQKWKEEICLLRNFILECGLTEVLKWGVPCYMSDKKNIVLIHVFKEYCAVLFFKGALLKDEKHILIQQTENVQSARQMRFTKVEEVNNYKHVLKAYISEAIKVEIAGLEIELLKPTAFKIPDEFQDRLNANKSLRSSFEILTPGRQRAYLLYFSAAKLTATRAARIEKCIPLIINGKGLND